MREALNPWIFVIAAHVVVLVSTLALVGWSWTDMRRAEKRREQSRET